jgi:hypothetical protein
MQLSNEVTKDLAQHKEYATHSNLISWNATQYFRIWVDLVNAEAFINRDTGEVKIEFPEQHWDDERADRFIDYTKEFCTLFEGK